MNDLNLNEQEIEELKNSIKKGFSDLSLKSCVRVNNFMQELLRKEKKERSKEKVRVWRTIYTSRINQLIYLGENDVMKHRNTINWFCNWNEVKDKNYQKGMSIYLPFAYRITPIAKKLLVLLMIEYAKDNKQKEFILSQEKIKSYFIPERLNDNPDKAKKYYYNILKQVKQAFEVLENITIYRQYKDKEQEFNLIEKNSNRLKNKSYTVKFTNQFFDYLKTNRAYSKINIRLFELDCQNEIFTLGLCCCKSLYEQIKKDYAELSFKTVASWNVDLNLEQAKKYRQLETKIYKPIIDRLKELEENLKLFDFTFRVSDVECKDFEAIKSLGLSNESLFESLKILLYPNEFTPIKEMKEMRNRCNRLRKEYLEEERNKNYTWEV